jgi:hypothetical protein
MEDEPMAFFIDFAIGTLNLHILTSKNPIGVLEVPLYQCPRYAHNVREDPAGGNLRARARALDNHRKFRVTTGCNNDNIVAVHKRPEGASLSFGAERKPGFSFLDYRYITKLPAFGGSLRPAFFKIRVRFFQLAEKSAYIFRLKAGRRQNRIDFYILKLNIKTTFPGKD